MTLGSLYLEAQGCVPLGVPWSQGLDLSLLLPVIGLIFTVVSKLLLLYSTIDKTSTLKKKSYDQPRQHFKKQSFINGAV